MDIIIDKNDLRRIKAKSMYPLMDEILLNDEEIKIYAVKPALDEYFRWFPKQAVYKQSVSGEFSIDFPDEFTFGIVDARITNQLAGLNTSVTGNRLMDILVLQRYSRSNQYRGAYGTPYNFEGQNRARLMDNQLRNMQMSKMENSKIVVRLEENKIKGYSAGTADLSIIWAKYSNNFNDIRFERKEDVIKLSQSYLLSYLSDAIGFIENTNLDIEIDASDLESKAKDLMESVLDDWKEFRKVLVFPKGMGTLTF